MAEATLPAPIPFSFEGRSVRIVDRDGIPWFVLADVCRVLDIANAARTADRLDADEKGVHSMNTLGGHQEMTIISEPGFYKLVGGSRKQAARRFDRWVRHDVLPSIRKHGGYIAGQEGLASGDMPAEAFLARAVVMAQRVLADRDAQIALLAARNNELAPRAGALALLTEAGGSLSLTEAAKTLKLGPKELLAVLGGRWIYRHDPNRHWLAYQTRIDSGDMQHVTHTVTTRDGREKIITQARVTAKGLAKIARYLAERAATATSSGHSEKAA